MFLSPGSVPSDKKLYNGQAGVQVCFPLESFACHCCNWRVCPLNCPCLLECAPFCTRSLLPRITWSRALNCP